VVRTRPAGRDWRPDVQPTTHLPELVRYGGGLRLALFGQASRDMGNPISRQHLGVIGLLSTLELPDLLGTALFSGFPILRSDGIRIDQLLSKGRLAKNQRSNKTQEPRTKMISRQISLACGKARPQHRGRFRRCSPARPWRL
jgi:hypothetical protein